MNYSLKIKLLELTQRALMVRADAQPDNGDKWRTTETGSKILLGKDGTVKGGMGGKFNGKNIKEVGGTKKFTKYQTNKEREQGNEPLKQHIGTEKFNNLHNGKAVKFYFNDPRTNEEVSATIKRDMVYDVPTYILSGNGAKRRVDEENIINMFERGEYRNEQAKQPTEPANLVEAENKTSNNLTKDNERDKISSPSQAEAGQLEDNKMNKFSQFESPTQASHKVGTIVRGNNGFVKITGVSKGESQGKNEEDFGQSGLSKDEKKVTYSTEPATEEEYKSFTKENEAAYKAAETKVLSEKEKRAREYSENKEKQDNLIREGSARMAKEDKPDTSTMNARQLKMHTALNRVFGDDYRNIMKKAHEKVFEGKKYPPSLGNLYYAEMLKPTDIKLVFGQSFIDEALKISKAENKTSNNLTK